MSPLRRRTPQREQPRPGSGFHITRLDPRPASRPEPVAPEPVPENLFAARFTSPAGVLTLVEAVSNESRRRNPPTLRAPDGAIWAVVDEHRPADVEMAWAVGGVVYLPDGLDLVSPRGHRYPWADLKAWPAVSWVELAARVAPGTSATEQQEILVVTTGSLARWIIDRFRSADLDLRVATAQLKGIFRPQSEDWAAVLVRVTARGRAVPRAFSHALAGLPHTVVCRPGGGRLLIDQRLALPVPDEKLTRLVPDDQQWLLAGSLGVWQFTERSPEYPPPLRAPVTLQPPPVPPQGRFPPDLGIEVTLVRDEQRRTVDALLLSDEELASLRRLLAGHPSGERAFLVLGAGWHLLADPGRDVSDIPFGVPLHRVGPGGLYQEVGYRLQPALPGPARSALFKLNDESLVILCSDRAHRLSLSSIVPVWSLWLGQSVAADVSAGPLSDSAKRILEQVDAAGAQGERPDLGTGAQAPELAGLRAEGFLLEQQGKLQEAAHKYWEAGEPALAAKLYELAAEADA
jgi:FtsH ternary system-associated peptide